MVIPWEFLSHHIDLNSELYYGLKCRNFILTCDGNMGESLAKLKDTAFGAVVLTIPQPLCCHQVTFLLCGSSSDWYVPKALRDTGCVGLTQREHN